jgi:tRNA-splicing ligase RtcB
MSKKKFTNQDMNKLGIYKPEMIRLFGPVMKNLLRKKVYSKTEIEKIIKKLIQKPYPFIDGYDGYFRELANYMIEKGQEALQKDHDKNETHIYHKPSLQFDLFEEAVPYEIFGAEYIEDDTIQQMETAARLPVSIKGALMPDAHVGYGLPIGGVLATKSNIVIPYAVGMDIACRMCMSVFDLPKETIFKEKQKLEQLLINNTYFGVGSTCKDHVDESVFDRSEWKSTYFLSKNKDLAWEQFGTSGAGNHFVEWGILEIYKDDKLLKVPSGKYLALLSHSGSRGFGAKIAQTYSKIAKQINKLPAGAQQLAWLEMESDEGREYWLAMNLAGGYASANHHEIHNKIAINFGITPMRIIENHHNFAWKERLEDGTEVIIHRKGATPAGKNNIGIIPGSMTHPGYVIRGKGNSTSLNSASHGAGRRLSRNQAFSQFTNEDLIQFLKDKGVELIGGDTDEAPMAYKDIDEVMNAQKDLVEVLAKFQPKIVRMAEPERRRKRR